VGLEAIGETDGRIALYLTDQLPLQHRPTPGNPDLSSQERALLDALTAQGATFFPALHEATGGGFAQETVDALWSLTWRGLVSNDGFFALRHLVRTGDRRIRRAMNDRRASFRSRRAIPPQAEGRWGLVSSRMVRPLVSATEWAHAAAKQLLARYGVVTREVATAESIPGGFSSLHDVFESLETSGRVRRGYFVEGVSAMQFGLPSVLDLLRSARREAVAQHDSDIVTLSSVDPANPYGALLPWPAEVATTVHPARISGSFVTFVDGQLVAWLSRGGKHAVVWVDNHTPHRERLLEVTARQFAARARSALQRSEGAMLETVNGAPANHSLLADALARAGFVRTDRGLLMRRSFTDS
jgi:ATP-dependent Lhr-like helicase